MARIALEVAFLPDTALRMGDAIWRTLWRLAVSRRNLLEWVTAARLSRRRRPGALAQYGVMSGGVVLGTGMALAAAAHDPGAGPLVAPFALL